MTVEFYQQRLRNIVIRPEIHEEVGSYVFKTVLPFLFVTLYHASMLSILFEYLNPLPAFEFEFNTHGKQQLLASHD